MNTIQNIDLEIEKLKTAKDISYEIYSNYAQSYAGLIKIRSLFSKSINEAMTELLLIELIKIANIDTNLLYVVGRSTEEIANIKSSVINILAIIGCSDSNISKVIKMDRSTVHYHRTNHTYRLKYYPNYNNIFSNLASYENHLRKILDIV